MIGKTVLFVVAMATIGCAANVRVVRQTTGCYYKSVTHRQGETWLDGCQYECTCVDATVGKYTCNTVCLNWNLPQQCHLSAPPPGKCCPIPVCPNGWKIDYPPNYVPK